MAPRSPSPPTVWIACSTVSSVKWWVASFSSGYLPDSRSVIARLHLARGAAAHALDGELLEEDLVRVELGGEAVRLAGDDDGAAHGGELHRLLSARPARWR